MKVWRNLFCLAVAITIVFSCVLQTTVSAYTQDDYNKVTNEINDLRKQISEYESQASALAAKANTISNQIAILQNQQATLKKQIDLKQAEHDQLVIEIETVQNRINENSDTVGFIKKLPTSLVEAFKSTLDEINGADLIIHVIDGSSEELAYQMDTVDEVLGQIGAEKIERIEVFNKSDLITSPIALKRLMDNHPGALIVSAHTGDGIDDLLKRIATIAASRDAFLNVVVPYSRGDLVAIAHKRCHIVVEEHEEDGTHLTMYVPPDCVHMFDGLAC